MNNSTTKRLIIVMIAITMICTLGHDATAVGTITGETNPCPGYVYTYTVDALPGCSVPSSITADHGTVVLGWSPPGTFSIKWKNESPTGKITVSCGVNSLILNVNIRYNPKPTINGTGTTINCGTGSLLITASASPTTYITSYHWTYPAGVTGPSSTSSPSVTVTYTAMGGGNVTVSSINANCSNLESAQSNPYTITRVSPPTPTLSKNSTHYELCSGESWIVTATSSFGTSYGYDWYISYGVTPGTGILLNGATTSSASQLHTSTNTVNVTAPSGYGAFYVNCRLNGSCTSSYAFLQGRASTYSYSEISISGPTTLCPNSTGYFTSSYSGSDITNYLWGISAGFASSSGQGTPYYSVVTASNFQSGQISLQLQNRCGLGGPSFKYVNLGSCGLSVIASPNPTSTQLDLTLTQNDVAVAPEKPIQANLLNSNNKTVWTGIISEKNASIDVSSFPIGIYYLKVNDGMQPGTTTRVIIER